MSELKPVKKKKKGFLEGYKTHTGPRGNREEWKAAFFERMGIDKAAEVLGTKDPLGVFGLASNATWDDIQTAYRANAKLYHPDRPGGSKEKMKEINAAYEILENRFRK
jgi:DnaJ-domain-containing protein 1